MDLSRNWLGDYAPIPDDVEVLVATLNGLGIEVADTRHVGGVAGVVTARVVRMDRHPDAAKVIRVWVDTGDGLEHHVWCGASNFAPGDVVPLATLGTTMPDGRTIGSRGILGIPSDGMLCSAHELGLGSDHSGILVLGSDVPLGVPYGDVTGLVDDLVIDVDVTRNRPDAFGHVGVARDVAAKLGLPFTPPRPTTPATGDAATASVEIVAGDRCGRFTLTILSGVEVAPERAMDGGPAARSRTAPDQQRRRRVQLRDAGTEPAEPRLRPGHPRRWRDSGTACHRRRAAHDPRRDDAHAHGGGVADLRRPRRTDRVGRDHGRRAHRDRRRDHHGCARVRLVRADWHRRQRHQDRPAQRRLDTVGARRGRLRHRHGDRSVRRAARRDVSRSRRARRRNRCQGRITASRIAKHLATSQPGQADHRRRVDAQRRRRAARSDRVHRLRGRPRCADRRVAELAFGCDRRDRRDRGDRPSLRLRERSQAGAALPATRTSHPGAGASPPRSGGAPRARHLRGDAVTVPLRRRPPPHRPRRRGPAHHQPARRRRGHSASFTPSGVAGCRRLQRVPSPPGRGAVRNRPCVPAGSRGAARRARDARRRPRRLGSAGRTHRLAGARRGARDGGADRPAARSSRAPPDAFGRTDRRP